MLHHKQEKMSHEKIVFVFKDTKPYGYIQGEDLFLFDKDKNEILANDKWGELFDILPEGIDLKIMINSFNIQNSKKELFKYLKNPIGNYSFSTTSKYHSEHTLSNYQETNFDFPNILNLKLNIGNIKLYPNKELSVSKNEIQHLSLSGYQHKLQVGIFDNSIIESYSNYILKPINLDIPCLLVNEHLHTTFMREFGFEVPFNALIFDEKRQDYHYIIKRFDIKDDALKVEQISLNALMKSKNKYDGTIDEASKFLSTRLSKNEGVKFINYIYANALLYNSDLHKKNISFIFKDNELKLSPAYDVINLYPLKGYSDNQTHLKISGKDNKIIPSTFDDIAQIFGINKKENRQNLENIFEIYKEKYPKYLEKFSQKFTQKYFQDMQRKMTNSYDLNLVTYKQKYLNLSLFKISTKTAEKIKSMKNQDSITKERIR